MLRVTNNVGRSTLANHRRRIAELRRVVDRWQAELKALGGRPRFRRGRPSKLERERVRPWMECHAAISGGMELLRELEHQAAELQHEEAA